MRLYVGFDDTDVAGADRGTGKLARWFETKLPEGVTLWGAVRQQLRMPPVIRKLRAYGTIRNGSDKSGLRLTASSARPPAWA